MQLIFPIPDISIFISPLSKASSIHCRTSSEAKFISSNIKGIPFLKAFIKGPSTISKPDKEFLSPINFCIKSFIFTSALKLNLIKLSSSLLIELFSFFFLKIYLQIISELNVLDVPVSPSKRTGIPFEI